MILFSVWVTVIIFIIIYFSLIYLLIKSDIDKHNKDIFDIITSAVLIGCLGLLSGIILYEFLKWYQITF